MKISKALKNSFLNERNILMVFQDLVVGAKKIKKGSMREKYIFRIVEFTF